VLLAPAATPGSVIARLHPEMTRIMASPDMAKRVSELGLIPFDTQPVDGIRTYIRSEQEKWGSLVRKLDLAGSQ
jgi:tripartite-type tricarboxylate transporter receptor subunit TctC